MGFLNLFWTIITFFKYPFYIVLGIIGYYFLSIYGLLIYNRIVKGKKIERGSFVKIKKRTKLQRLLIDFPKQYSRDLLNRPKDFFPHQGLIIYEGRQGSGKTTSMVHDSLLIKSQYPKSKMITNLNVKNQDATLAHWSQLVDYKNGYYGVLVIMDELQNWFSSNQSKDFPPEMLSVITQNRKNRRVIFGTAQSFHLLAKSIRSQCTEVRKCFTFFGCITFVKRKEPILNSDGDVEEWKPRGIYFFVHDEMIRAAFDTWAVVAALGKSGFKPTVNVTAYEYKTPEAR